MIQPRFVVSIYTAPGFGGWPDRCDFNLYVHISPGVRTNPGIMVNPILVDEISRFATANGINLTDLKLQYDADIR